MIYKYDGWRDYSTQVEYHRNKTGPNYFVVYYKQRSVVCYDRIDVKRCFGPAKFTPSVTELGKWCDEMIDKYDKTEKDSSNSLDPEVMTKAIEQLGALDPKILATGFGPECHEEDLEDPTKDTRMVI